jgi:DNA modification methylase
MDYLKPLPNGCVQTCVTSPPYWGLRDYGVEGQLGLEPTPEEYIEKMVTIFREVRRVLRDDGTLWLNLGDSYCAAAPGSRDVERWPKQSQNDHRGYSKLASGLKPKDLCGIPWRVAFALQADGWWLRSDIIWSKPNPMPESVTDRPTKAHEYVFLLTKSARYYFEQEAVREPCESGPSDIKKMIESKERIGGRHKVLVDPLSMASSATNIGRKRAVGKPTGRNIRSVWTIPTQPFPEAHYATYPERLVEPCIKAGSKEGDTVLDPFMGSGTTALVAVKLRRHFIGCDLNPENVEMAYRRLSEVQVKLL